MSEDQGKNRAVGSQSCGWPPKLSLQTDEEILVNRRGYLTLLMGASSAFFLATLPFVCKVTGSVSAENPRLAVSKVEDLPPGDAVPFTYPDPDTPALLVHLPSGEWRAYAGTCTHLGCLVHWDIETGNLLCPCHTGIFNAETGAVIAGPPPRPLPRIDLSVENGVVFAVGVRA